MNNLTKEELLDAIYSLRAETRHLEAIYHKLYVCKDCYNTGMIFSDFEHFRYCSCENGKIAEERKLEPGSV